jgi:nucleoside-diphosphate-sugar epimerase/predicted dehydrogenase
MAVKDAPRLAVIGCGAAVEFSLLPALRRIGWRPSVLIDRSPARLAAVVRRFGRRGITRTMSDWRAAASEFDAAIVTLPHYLHGTAGIDLIGAKKHVMMQAPLATRGDDGRAMIAAARDNNVKLSVGLHRRYLQVARWTKALLQSGALGEIKHIDVREGTIFVSDTRGDVDIQPDIAAGGVLTDTGTHTLDLLQWWLGGLDVLTYCDDNQGGVEADCILEVRLPSGGGGRIEISRTRQLRNSARIGGTRGFVEVHLHKNEVLGGSPETLDFAHDGVGPRQLVPQFAADLVEAELMDFKSTILEPDWVGVPGSDGLPSVELIERCYAIRQPLLDPWAQPHDAVSATSDAPIAKLPSGSKVLVTGATGFIGGRLVERLVKDHGTEIRCTIRNIGRAARLARFPTELVQIDLGNAAAVDRVIKGVDYVFHCAHDTHAPAQNLDGLRNIINSCIAHSVSRLIYVSTSAVYEPLPDGPLTEQTRDGDRSNPYVDTKLAMEAMIFDAGRSGKLMATIVQPAIVYGPFCQVWTNTPAEMLMVGDVILPDHGEGLCNAVYIDDLIDSLILAAQSDAAAGERFIVAGPRPITWATFFTEIARATGASPPKFLPLSRISEAAGQAHRQIRNAIDPRRLIKAALHWQPVRNIVLASIERLPSVTRVRIKARYFAKDRRLPKTFLPNPHALALYRANASVSSGKARSKLGYRPRFEFEQGMALTASYLRWAYADAQAD